MLQNIVLLKVFSVLQSRKTSSSFSGKPNAFLIISDAILRFGLQNDQNSTGFIRYFDQLFPMLQNDLGPMLFDILHSPEPPPPRPTPRPPLAVFPGHGVAKIPALRKSS